MEFTGGLCYKVMMKLCSLQFLFLVHYKSQTANTMASVKTWALSSLFPSEVTVAQKQLDKAR